MLWIAFALSGLAISTLAFRMGYGAGYQNGNYDAGVHFGREMSLRAPEAATEQMDRRSMRQRAVDSDLPKALNPARAASLL